ncbi:hypothetical protein KUCAC02_006371, partial [Chaenocephalus aceratus]
ATFNRAAFLRQPNQMRKREGEKEGEREEAGMKRKRSTGGEKGGERIEGKKARSPGC